MQDSFLVELEKNNSKRNTDRKGIEKAQSVTKISEDKTKPSDKKSFLSNNESTIPNQSKLKFSNWDSEVHEHSLHSILEERLTKHRDRDISGDLRNLTSKVDRIALNVIYST